MKRNLLVRAVFAVSVMLIAACGAPAANPAPTGAPAATGMTVKVAKSSLGQVLVDDKGMTLYMFAKDTNGVSVCYDACAQSWPSLITTDKPQAGDGVNAALLGTAARKDGSLQVTYNKLPLYHFATDKAAGDTHGQGIGSVWFVVAPTGDPIKPAATGSGSVAAGG